MKPRDPLADHVEVRRPQPFVPRIGESRGRQIVDQRVEPDVHRLLAVAGEGNAPRQALPRNRHVLEPVLEQPHDFVAPDRRLDAKLARRYQREQPLAVGAQPEEVVALLGRDELQRRVLDAMAVRDLRRRLELLAAGAVQPLVIGDVEIGGAQPLDALEQRDDAAHVPGLGRADPVVVAALEPPPVVREGPGHAVDPRARRHVPARRRLNHRLAVLVHSHQEMHLVAAQAPVAGDAVGADLLQGVPQVGIAVGIVDRGGEVELR